MHITDLVITPIAFRDPPLLNSWGVHEPLALRSIVQLVVGDTVVGLGEGSGELRVLAGLATAREAIVGLSVFDTTGVERAIAAAVLQSFGDDAAPTDPAVASAAKTLTASVFSIIEVACLDAQGKITGLPVSELLGGRVRDAVPYSAYLFYKWAEHPDDPAGPDRWGAALDPAGVVSLAHRFINEYGFRSIKLKAGVFAPDEEIAAMRALADAFPGMPLRIDPNGAWTVETSIQVARALDGVLEYLEDPTLGQPGMAQVAAAAPMPLATNMCVVGFDDIPEAVRNDSVQIILSDHHYWGGLRRTHELGRLCETFGIGLSMHSNSHLGISLAAMTHVAAAIPNLSYACDTHYPWNAEDDVIVPGPLRFEGGSVPVPTSPGLGVELDETALADRHRTYLESGRTVRDDTGYMRRVRADYDPTLPRF